MGKGLSKMKGGKELTSFRMITSVGGWGGEKKMAKVEEGWVFGSLCKKPGGNKGEKKKKTRHLVSLSKCISDLLQKTVTVGVKWTRGTGVSCAHRGTRS